MDDTILKLVLAEILEEIHDLSECQSVGIRLHKNGDYPYFVHEGFPKFFIQKEFSLCKKDKNGQEILDEKGNPLLDCMCGNVIRNRFDTKYPYFTTKGSFWTNSTTHLLETTTENERLGETRNMCHHSGYESVALIPLIANDKTLGLIQFNDSRLNNFSLGMINNYENLADQIAEVISNTFEIQERMGKISDSIKHFKTSKN